MDETGRVVETHRGIELGSYILDATHRDNWSIYELLIAINFIEALFDVTGVQFANQATLKPALIKLAKQCDDILGPQMKVTYKKEIREKMLPTWSPGK